MNDEVIQELIRVTPPTIDEQLVTLREQWMQEAEAAKRYGCTPATLRTVKAARAEMRKSFDAIEIQRKAAIQPIRDKLGAFQAVYKECVTDPFTEADAIYKAKIEDVENHIKGECERRMKDYFEELRQVHNVPSWLTYERAGLKIDLTSAKQARPTKLMDALNTFVSRVALDLDSISKLDDGPEVLVEYQRTLNLSQSISIVQDRKRAVEEAQRQQAEREAAEQQVQAAVERVEAFIPAPVPVPVNVEQAQEQEKVYRCTFTVSATKAQLRGLKQYMKEAGISYE